MPDDSSANSIASLELAVLRSLCASPDLNAARARIDSALSGYRWRDSDHAIVFQALGRVPGRDKRPLREQLPAIATRMGFPDIDWESYFVNDTAIPEEQITNLLRKLTASPTPRE
jgi:hypothetical protein